MEHCDILEKKIEVKTQITVCLCLHNVFPKKFVCTWVIQVDNDKFSCKLQTIHYTADHMLGSPESPSLEPGVSVNSVRPLLNFAWVSNGPPKIVEFVTCFCKGIRQNLLGAL